MTIAPVDLVVIDYADILDPIADVSRAILEAFGADGLGVLAIKNIPDWEVLTKKTLPVAHKLVNLPGSTLKSLEHEDSLFNSGWSFGKEKLGDKPDVHKASYYFNPLSDDARPETRELYPWALPANRWPSEELPEMEAVCKSLGSLMHSVTVSLARRIDGMGLGTKIADEMESSLKAKGRLLYYFPVEGESDKNGEWIGWHNDSGFLTALTPDVFMVHSTGEQVANPEPENCGLWVAARNGELHRVSVPKDCMAVQCGECMQVITGGRLVATPHCVRPPTVSEGVARVSMPVFVDVSPDFPLKSPLGREAVFVNTVKQKVPPLSDRWTEGASFADFLGASFKAYYQWSKQ
jgi:isopenicillin N synthase-like dioxygenase